MSWQPPRGTWLGVYYIETSDDLRRTAEFIAREESAGGWSGTDSPTARYARSVASVHDVQETTPGAGYAAIAFPLENLPDRGSLFPALWLYLTAGPLFERPFAAVVRLADVVLPEEVLRAFRGPRFGLAGTRQTLGGGDGALLVGAIVKPGAGLVPEEVAARCAAAAEGGVDLIKDDEKMNNPAYCPLVPRVQAVSAALRRVQDRTGRPVIYCAHVTGRPDEMVQSAHQAVRAGASGIMVNVFAAGLSALQMLSEDDAVAMPIYVHSGGRSVLSQPGANGIETRVFAKFVRLLGGDYLDVYAQGGYLRAGTLEQARALAEALREPWGPIVPVLPACSGGLSARTLAANYAAFGRDLLPMAGSAIFNHPLGPAAGAVALRLAADSYFSGVSLEESARGSPELLAALQA